MNGQLIIFCVLAVIGLTAAIRLVTARNVVHGALSLVIALGVVAAIYLLLGAEFVGWVQVLIYVGAIVVLLLFALMLTKAPIGRHAFDNQHRLLAALVALFVFGGLAYLLNGAWSGEEVRSVATSSEQIGSAIFADWVLPFEVVSVLLLAALVGAVVLARKDDDT